LTRLALGTTLHYIEWVLGVIQLGLEIDRSHPSSAKVKKEWSYTSVRGEPRSNRENFHWIEIPRGIEEEVGRRERGEGQ
jgi:hypothetical protein